MSSLNLSFTLFNWSSESSLVYIRDYDLPNIDLPKFSISPPSVGERMPPSVAKLFFSSHLTLMYLNSSIMALTSFLTLRKSSLIYGSSMAGQSLGLEFSSFLKNLLNLLSRLVLMSLNNFLI